MYARICVHILYNIEIAQKNRCTISIFIYYVFITSIVKLFIFFVIFVFSFIFPISLSLSCSQSAFLNHFTIISHAITAFTNKMICTVFY